MSPGSPEQQAREEIDKALDAAGWVIQDRAELTLIAYGAFAEALKHWEVSRNRHWRWRRCSRLHVRGAWNGLSQGCWILKDSMP